MPSDCAGSQYVQVVATKDENITGAMAAVAAPNAAAYRELFSWLVVLSGEGVATVWRIGGEQLPRPFSRSGLWACAVAELSISLLQMKLLLPLLICVIAAH